MRDSLGSIEKFNINYDPEFSPQFKNIIEKLKSNFLLKEIFFCFQNEKWRDDLYNYSSNNVLFGLSKYLKLEKIKNVIAVEKSKCLDKIKKEKKLLLKEDRFIKEQLLIETNLLKKINLENGIYPNMSNSDSSGNSLQLNNNDNNSLLFSRYKSEEMPFLQFKEKFFNSLKENYKYETEDDLKYLDLQDDYLLTLYNKVYLNNPDHDFIFQHPSLILNYIYIDISNTNEIKKEINKIILTEEIKEEESKNNYHSSENKKNSNSSKNNNHSEEKKEEEIKTNNNLDENEDNKEILNDKSKLIEKINDIEEKVQKNSPETPHIYKYFYLKYENEEDNLQIVSKVSQLSYIFVRKRDRSSTTCLSGNFNFGKKRISNFRKSVLPKLFSKQNYKDIENVKGIVNLHNILSSKKSKKTITNRKFSVITKSYNANQSEKHIIKAKKEIKKPLRSCNDLHKRFSIQFNSYVNQLLDNENNKAESSSKKFLQKVNINKEIDPIKNIIDNKN